MIHLKVVREHIIFFGGYILFLLFGLYLNLQYTQKQLFFFVNRHHTTFLDYFMRAWTNVGDGVTAIVLFFLLGFLKVRYAIVGLLSYAISGLLAQVMKRYVFPDSPRPWREWAADNLYMIKGFTPYSNNSFPSGHTTTAFCMATLLTLFFKDKKLGWLWLLLALLVAYSRIYLAQHHFRDVYWGSILGTLSSIAIYYYFYLPKHKFNRQPTWFDRPLHKIKG